MAEPQTIGVQIKVGKQAAASTTAILRHEEDEVILRAESPATGRVELHFNYLPILEFLWGVEKERKKVKLKRM